jgi:hypothetical protein
MMAFCLGCHGSTVISAAAFAVASILLLLMGSAHNGFLDDTRNELVNCLRATLAEAVNHNKGV